MFKIWNFPPVLWIRSALRIRGFDRKFRMLHIIADKRLPYFLSDLKLILNLRNQQKLNQDLTQIFNFHILGNYSKEASFLLFDPNPIF